MITLFNPILSFAKTYLTNEIFPTPKVGLLGKYSFSLWYLISLLESCCTMIYDALVPIGIVRLCRRPLMNTVMVDSCRGAHFSVNNEPTMENTRHRIEWQAAPTSSSFSSSPFWHPSLLCPHQRGCTCAGQVTFQSAPTFDWIDYKYRRVTSQSAVVLIARCELALLARPVMPVC